MFVLIGHHRSGTSFVNSVVRAHPDVESINEPMAQHLDVFRDYDMEPWAGEELTETCLHPRIPPRSATEEFLLDLRRWLRGGGRVRGFKETCLAEKLPWLWAFLGPVGGVVLARDPRAVVASVLRRDLDRSWWAYAERIRSYPSPPGGDPPPVDLEDRAAVCAHVWSRRMLHAVEFAIARGWPVLRLEDLLVDPETQLDRLMDTIGVDPHPQQRNFLEESWVGTFGGTFSYRRSPQAVLDTWKEVLDGADVRAVELHAGPAMDALGYGR